MFRRISLLALMILAMVGGSGCMIIAVRDDLQAQVVEIDGQKYLIDEEGHAHKMVE